MVVYNVMIVDDEVSVCKGLCVVVDWERYGFRIAGFSCDGAGALEQLRRDPYDLVISDIRMPGLSGLELLSELAQIDYRGHTIILSAYADFEYAQQAIKHGASAYLLKPVNEAMLIDAITHVRARLDAAHNRESPTPARGPSAPADIVNAAIVRINENYGNLTVGTLAQQLFITPNHLSRIFRRRMGVGLNEYMGKVRMDKARQMLANPDILIYDVCSRVGFKDVDYFCRVFKAATGLTPSAYRSGCK